LDRVGLGERLHREGHEHRGIYLQWPHERHHIDFAELTGRTVWVYGQTEVTKDLNHHRDADGQQFCYDVRDTELHDVDTDRPSVSFTSDGQRVTVEADVIAGCDGSFGPSRAHITGQTWQRTYPYSWLGVLADVAPSTAELIY